MLAYSYFANGPNPFAIKLAILLRVKIVIFFELVIISERYTKGINQTKKSIYRQKYWLKIINNILKWEQPKQSPLRKA